jgi:N-acetylmuramoyl-L-alanine amidase
MMKGSLAILVLLSLCVGTRGDEPQPKVGEKVPRVGDEIVVCGQLFHTTTKVVLWMDPGGFDAYRVGTRFGDIDHKPTAEEREKSAVWSAHYNGRDGGLPKAERERWRGGYDMPKLREVVDQFVIHYDVAGTSRNCFETLQDKRGLSVHFMLDVDGTIYQSLDLKERAWHATKANNRSVGIEVANIGAYPVGRSSAFAKWYRTGADGKTFLVVPDAAKSSVFNSSIDLRPSRNEPVVGAVHGKKLEQYDFTPQQYEALARLTATLCTVFPKIKCDYPRDSSGALLTKQIPTKNSKDYQGILYKDYQGIMGHYHVQTDKTDPGPAFQWDWLIQTSRKLMAK